MRAACLSVLALALPIRATAAPEDPVAAVRAAFIRYDTGWRSYDVAGIISVFAPDFEWTNSVGLRFTSKPGLATFLTHLFSLPGFRAGIPGPLVIRSIRLLAPDVAVISSSEVTDGQKTWDTHKIVPHQHTNELTVMQRSGGHWLIVSDLDSDEANGI